MEKGRPMLRWVGILCVSMAMAGLALNALGGKQSPEATKQVGGADLILIDTLKKFAPLEYPVVRFEHDKHTKAMENKCEICHTVTGTTVAARFKRQDDANAAAIKAVYHDNCIKCHTETVQTGKKSGPQAEECRTCHAGTQGTSRTIISFDKSLHFRHSSSKAVLPVPGQKENCSSCHAQDKPEKRNLAFAENTEQAHEKCISCHLGIAKTGQPSGPVACATCHDAAIRSTFKQVRDIPRLNAGQADVILLMTEAKAKAEPVVQNVVPFNHKGHEEKTATCSSCHHNAFSKGVVSCGQCHTALGKKEGDFITTEQAMHGVRSQASCIGCHVQAQSKPQCAGCHTLMGRTGQNAEKECGKCHVNMTAGPELGADKTVRTATAVQLISSRPKSDASINLNDIPEFVEIDALANEYKASKFPHRKIMKTILEGMKDESMAAYFHSSPKSVCAGCHHNSPVSANPPKCASCHGLVANKEDGAKPALKAAYHQQCMGCHKAMGIEKPADTACTECHAAKQ